MEIGLHIPNAQSGANPDDILAAARTAERLGFDGVWMFDHLFTPTDLGSAYPYSRDGAYALSAEDPFFDPLGLFGVLAGATDALTIGTGVLVAAYRHPIVLAKTIATIERFAPGRLRLGVGTGWMREEFDALGIPFERRGARLDEYLEALRVLWSGRAESFDGEFYSWVEAGFLPAPTAPIPLIVGGHSDRALERAAKHGDGWAAVTTREQGHGLDGLRSRLEVLDRYLEKAGRDRGSFELLYQQALWFSDSPHPKLPLTGPPEVIAENLTSLREQGITMVDLVVFGPAPVISECATRFAEEVRPLL
ncbi:MAG: TIGR03619 family F420-dependent LLM class oxidoreductase [Actinomycetota bacterium]